MLALAQALRELLVGDGKLVCQWYGRIVLCDRLYEATKSLFDAVEARFNLFVHRANQYVTNHYLRRVYSGSIAQL